MDGVVQQRPLAGNGLLDLLEKQSVRVLLRVAQEERAADPKNVGAFPQLRNAAGHHQREERHQQVGVGVQDLKRSKARVGEGVESLAGVLAPKHSLEVLREDEGSCLTPESELALEVP
eukprot:scaffold1245_cov252-Pinguiococcus_pyrenoidosus.AAC.18